MILYRVSGIASGGFFNGVKISIYPTFFNLLGILYISERWCQDREKNKAGDRCLQERKSKNRKKRFLLHTRWSRGIPDEGNILRRNIRIALAFRGTETGLSTRVPSESLNIKPRFLLTTRGITTGQDWHIPSKLHRFPVRLPGRFVSTRI